MHHSPPKHASYFWKGLNSVKYIIERGSCFQIDSGHSIDIWIDP